MMATALIHVIDDDDDQRDALLRLLGAAGHDVRGHASAGAFLLQRVPDRPGCLMLDLRMPGPSGLDLQAVLEEKGIRLPVIFISGNADVASSVRAMKAGAVDFLTKPVDRLQLFRAIDDALARDATMRRKREESRRMASLFASLSERERAVLERIVAGSLNKQIAVELGIAERTVKLHRANLMAKLEVGSPAQLGQFAERLQEQTLPQIRPDQGT